MKLFPNVRIVRSFLWPILAVCSLQIAWAGPIGIYQHGTVVRMEMGDCSLSPSGFAATFGGPATHIAAEVCPEYTLISDKVVFVIVGRSAGALVPLADVIDFRLHNKEMAVRIDDAKHEVKFNIKVMILRSEWDMVQKHITNELNAPAGRDENVAMRNAH